MKSSLIKLVALLVIPLLLPAQEEVERAVVTADRLNVRAGAGTRYEVIAQLREHTEVRVLRRQEVWVGIQTPPHADAWVPANSLDAQGVVTEEELHIHAGPGIYYTGYGVLKKGDKVEVRRKKDGLWAEIVPPEGVVSWVHGDYLKAPSTAVDPPEGEEAGDPEIAADPTDQVEPSEQVEALPPPGDDAAQRTVGSPQQVERTGYIVPLGSEPGPWTFALAQKVEQRYYPIAYLGKGYPDMKQWLWKEVVVTGMHEWLQGWPRPRITIESLKLASEGEPERAEAPAAPAE